MGRFQYLRECKKLLILTLDSLIVALILNTKSKG